MTEFSPEAKTLFRLLNGGEWHDYTPISDKLARTIAPGKALRRYEERRKRRQERLTGAPLKEPSEDDKILFGQRLLANSVINGIKQRYLDIEETGEGRKIRMKPGIDVQLPPQPPEMTGSKKAAEETVESVSEATESPEVLPVSEAPEAPESVSEPVEAAPVVVEAAVELTPPPADPGGETTPVILPPDLASPFFDDGPMPQICQSCGAWALEREMHEGWHDDMADAALESLRREMAGQEVRPEMALFDEAQVRLIVAQELATQLDTFQVGLQQWLGTVIEDRKGCLIERLYGPPRFPGRETDVTPVAR